MVRSKHGVVAFVMRHGYPQYIKYIRTPTPNKRRDDFLKKLRQFGYKLRCREYRLIGMLWEFA